MAAAVRPGGVVIVEDIDFGGYFCYPACRAHDNYMKWYRETVRRRGGSADLGPMLPELLGDAGIENVSASVSQECDVSGDTKLIPPITLERIADAVVSEGVATEEDVADALDDLFARSADTTTLMGMPRIVQAWGTTPERAI